LYIYTIPTKKKCIEENTIATIPNSPMYIHVDAKGEITTKSINAAEIQEEIRFEN
jgi:hypothetical protein